MAFYLILAIFFIVSDRFLKVLAVHNFFDPPIGIIGDVFQLNLAKNYGIAFSLPLRGFFLNVLILILVLALISVCFFLVKKRDSNNLIPLMFVVFGAVSNFFDRIKYGFVVDYFDVRYFTVFNLADVIIVVGVFFVVYKNFFTKRDREMESKFNSCLF